MQTIKKISVVNAVIEQLLSAIHSGRYTAGSKIPSERELTQMLGVSRTALREAEKRLESLGILSTRQGSGTYVNDQADQRGSTYRSELKEILTLGNISVRDFVDARVLIETKAVDLVVERASDDELVELDDLCNKMSKLLGDSKAYAQFDWLFHRKLIYFSKNPILKRFQDSISDLLKTQILRSINTHSNLQYSLDAHLEIMRWIKCRNGKRAMVAIEKHLTQILDRLASAVQHKLVGGESDICLSDLPTVTISPQLDI